jgi:hypothetical protein
VVNQDLRAQQQWHWQHFTGAQQQQQLHAGASTPLLQLLFQLQRARRLLRLNLTHTHNWLSYVAQLAQ